MIHKGIKYTIKKWWFNRLKNRIISEQKFTKKQILNKVIDILKYSFSTKQKIEIHTSNFRDYLTVSNNDFISKIYIYSLDNHTIFEKSKIAEHIGTMFSDDKLIIVAKNNDYIDNLVNKHDNVYLIQIESLNSYKESFQQATSTPIKDINYLYEQLYNIINNEN